jgi:galactitol-specific phosphotransferase system IIC component
VNPLSVGWLEFGLRLLAVTLVVAIALLVTAVVARVTIDLWDAAHWVARKGWRGEPQ